MTGVERIRDGLRVRDPANRDQDQMAWRRGRFAERVRREWNPIRTPDIEACRQGDAYDVKVLASAIHKVVGGNLAPIEARLSEFAAMEAIGRPERVES